MKLTCGALGATRGVMKLTPARMRLTTAVLYET
jgi:hypothetical protein